MSEKSSQALDSVSGNITFLKDYQPPRYFIDKTDLIFILDAEKLW